MRKHTFTPVVLCLLLTALAAGCTSRYRLDLYMLRGEERKKVGINKTEFLKDAVIGNPYSKGEKTVTGDGNCLVISTGTRGETQGGDKGDILAWDRYLQFDIYIQFPLTAPSGNIPLEKNSFLYLLGHFERSVDEAVYMPTEGVLKIDSLTDSHLFGTLDGRFENSSGEKIGFNGQFKAKVDY